MATPEQRDFGLYFHWPFCQAKCPYCDFNSHVAAHVDHDRWLRAYLAEIERVRAETGPRVLHSIFFGGGTPSLMDPTTVAAVLEASRRAWNWANDVEVTLEANPTSVEAGRFREFRDAGVNRVSIGIQALNDSDLRRLGRLHSATEARAAFDLARSTFPRVSFDLIYARQDQTIDAWRSELAEALSLAADHLSLYQLTIESGTAFGDRLARGGLSGLPDEDLSVEMYEVTQDLCGAAGFYAYEISNHAKPGAESRHNLIYWRSGDWAGIGPGAHGRLSIDGRRIATATELMPLNWLNRVETYGSGETTRTELSTEDEAEEYLMMGLRLLDGVNLERLDSIGLPRPDPERIEHLVALNLIEMDGTSMNTTPTGRLVLNSVLRELLT